MRAQTGVWLDHRKAVIVAVTSGVETITKINSNVERRIHPSDVVSAGTQYGPQPAPPDDLRERFFKEHLRIYFDRIIASVREASSILIFGPGEAKWELKKSLESNKLAGLITGMETTDNMSEAQIAAKVRQHFTVPVRY